MIKVYHVPNSRSLRVVWLLEELGEPYELDTSTFPLDERVKAVSAPGTVPAVADGDIVMGESIAILQYLTGRRLQRSLELGLTVGPSPDPAAYAEHLQFLHLGEASLMTPASILARTLRLAPEEAFNVTAQACRAMFVTRAAVIEARLADGRPHLTGRNFTIADISVGSALAFAEQNGLDDLIPDRARSYLERLKARPAFAAAAAV